MSDFCLFCRDKTAVTPKPTKKLPQFTPLTPSEYWELMNSDMSSFPPYVPEDPSAPPAYGIPYSGMIEAQAVFTAILPVLLAGVATKVSKRVVPIWYLYMNGGVNGVIDLATFNPSFVKDFQEDPSTLWAMGLIKVSVLKYFQNNPLALHTASTAPKEFDLASIIPNRLANFANYQSEDQLNFSTIGSVAGNLIGGFGPPNDQTDNLFGHTPSRQNDSRRVTGKVTISPHTPLSGTFQPQQSSVRQYRFDFAVDFDVKDTIDFCPGNFGSTREDGPFGLVVMAEEDLTVPLSRLEASRMVGDVPVQINYQVKDHTILTINS